MTRALCDASVLPIIPVGSRTVFALKIVGTDRRDEYVGLALLRLEPPAASQRGSEMLVAIVPADS